MSSAHLQLNVCLFCLFYSPGGMYCMNFSHHIDRNHRHTVKWESSIPALLLCHGMYTNRPYPGEILHCTIKHLLRK